MQNSCQLVGRATGHLPPPAACKPPPRPAPLPLPLPSPADGTQQEIDDCQAYYGQGKRTADAGAAAAGPRIHALPMTDKLRRDPIFLAAIEASFAANDDDDQGFTPEQVGGAESPRCGQPRRQHAQRLPCFAAPLHATAPEPPLPPPLPGLPPVQVAAFDAQSGGQSDAGAAAADGTVAAWIYGGNILGPASSGGTGAINGNSVRFVARVVAKGRTWVQLDRDIVHLSECGPARSPVGWGMRCGFPSWRRSFPVHPHVALYAPCPASAASLPLVSTPRLLRPPHLPQSRRAGRRS